MSYVEENMEFISKLKFSVSRQVRSRKNVLLTKN